jgi:hypothetical protein
VPGAQPLKGHPEPFKTLRDSLPEEEDGRLVTSLDLLHQAIHLGDAFGPRLEGPVGRDIDPGNMVVALLTGQGSVRNGAKAPHHDGDLAAHVIDIVLDFKRIPRLPETPAQRVSEDRVPDVPDVKGAVWVGAGVLEDHTLLPARVCTVAGTRGILECPLDDLPAEMEIQVGSKGLDCDIPKILPRCKCLCQLPGDHGRVFPPHLREPECNGACEIRVFSPLDQEHLLLAGRLFEGILDGMVEC